MVGKPTTWNDQRAGPLSSEARAPGFDLDQFLSRFTHCSLMRLQNILQSLLHCVVGVGVAGALLGLVRDQVGART